MAKDRCRPGFPVEAFAILLVVRIEYWDFQRDVAAQFRVASLCTREVDLPDSGITQPFCETAKRHERAASPPAPLVQGLFRIPFSMRGTQESFPLISLRRVD